MLERAQNDTEIGGWEVKQAIALLTSAGTLIHMWQAGRKWRWTWLVGLANQAVWLAFIVAFGAWGLLPLSAALIVVYTRNHVLWGREVLEKS